MAGLRLTDTDEEGSDGLSALWPMPGNLVLVVLAAWLFYMGSIAGMDDVRAAFYGLGGVTLLVLLLALRTLAVGRFYFLKFYKIF
jgi:hypothetical protein